MSFILFQNMKKFLTNTGKNSLKKKPSAIQSSREKPKFRDFVTSVKQNILKNITK